MRPHRLLAIVSVVSLFCFLQAARATVSSGNGQTTKARSVSVTMASDETLPPKSADHSTASTFALDSWYGTLGGTALATDPDPNVTPPASNRIIRMGSTLDGVTSMGGPHLISAAILDGTTLTYQAWFYDNSQAKWIKIHSTVVLTLTTNNFRNLNIVPGNLSGAKVFIQITANSGVTVLGVTHR